MLRRLVAGQAVVAILIGVALAAPAIAASKPPKPTKPATAKVSTCTDPTGDGISEQVGPTTDHPAEDIVTASVKRSGNNVVVELHLAADLPAQAPRLALGDFDALRWWIDTATDTKGVKGAATHQMGAVLKEGWKVYVYDWAAKHQTDLTVAPVVNGSTITFTVPKSSVPNLGKTFFWHAGTEAAATPLGSTLYNDRCPGGGGFDAPDTEWTRAS